MDEFEFGEHVDVAGAPDAVERVRCVTTGASGAPAENGQVCATALFDCGVINRPCGRLWPAAEHTLALVAYVVVLGSPLTHSCLIVLVGSSERAILVHCIERIASSGTR
jgi:hypothetical protein